MRHLLTASYLGPRHSESYLADVKSFLHCIMSGLFFFMCSWMYCSECWRASCTSQYTTQHKLNALLIIMSCLKTPSILVRCTSLLLCQQIHFTLSHYLLKLKRAILSWGTFSLKICTVLLWFPGWITCFLRTVCNMLRVMFSLVWWGCLLCIGCVTGDTQSAETCL